MLEKPTKKLTPKQWYNFKLKYLRDRGYQEVKPLDFYRELFPVGSFEEKGIQLDRKQGGKPNGILVKLGISKGRRQRIITDDLEEIKKSIGDEDVILSPISYEGKARRTINARYLYAVTFDLDGQEIQQLHDTFHQMKNNVIPPATYVIFSGHGLHLYYFLKNPLRLDTEIIRELNKFKTGLTKVIWNSFLSLQDPQFQPIMQGFRMVGSASKLGNRYPVRAFKYTDKRYTIEELNDYILTTTKEWRSYRIDLRYVGKTPIEQAKELWPDWYERRIKKGQKKGRWHIKRALYDWWLDRLHREIKVGHRYFAIMTLAIYAMKCNIPYDELKKDAYSLLEPYDEMTDKEDNHFTKDDIETALQVYHEGANNYPRDLIGKFAGIPIKVNKRNYRTQSEHLKMARFVRDELNGRKDNWREGNGRPKGSKNKNYQKKEIIKKWRENNPTGKKIDCHRDTKIDPKTIRKWW